MIKGLSKKLQKDGLCVYDRPINEATKKTNFRWLYLEDVRPVLVGDQTMTSHQQHDHLGPQQQGDEPKIYINSEN